jgi:protocatechuate 3,4-dioxygenase beta subunit
MARLPLRLIAATLAFLAADGTARARGQLATTGVVAGQVIDATTKRPISRAIVTLSTAAASGASPQPAAPATQTRRAVAITNTDGRFVFRDVPAGVFALTSTLDTYAPGATGRRRLGGPAGTFSLDAGARVTDVVLTMWRLSAISGVIRDDRGEPLIGTYVRAMRRSLNGGRFELGFDGGGGSASDDRGHYRISGLLPGSYVVNVFNNFSSAAVSTVDAFQAAVTAGTAGAITREWPRSGALRLSTSGIVIDEWQVWVSGGERPPLPGPGGTLLIHPTVFYPSARSASEATVLTLSAGDDRTGIDLTLPLLEAVRVSGVLMGPEGPAANHGIRLMPDSTSDPVFDAPAAYSTTDRSGNFTFLGVAPGAYVIRAYRVAQTGPTYAFTPAPPGAPPGSDRVEMIPPPATPSPSLFADVPITVGSANVSNVAVTLQRGARLSGKVVFEGATPPTTAEIQRTAVVLKPLTGALPTSSIQPDTGPRLDAAGAFQLLGHPPGRYHVDVTTPSAAWSVASIRLGGIDAAGQSFALGTTDVDEVVVTMTDKPMVLSGSVRPADSAGSPESTVLVFPADFAGWIASGMSSRRTGTAQVSASGSYAIRVPLPGDYIVVAVPAEITASLEPDFLKGIAPQGVRVSLGAGESKTQGLTVSRSR